MNPSTRSESAPFESLGSAVRLVGIAILLAGLAVGFKVIAVAWDLFDNQSKVVTLAQTMEQHCGINGFVRTYVGTLLPTDGTAPARPSGAVPALSPEAAAKLSQSLQGVDLVYFFAWAITITLLSTIARIASWAIAEGGRLALTADPSKEQIKELVRELIAESRPS